MKKLIILLITLITSQLMVAQAYKPDEVNPDTLSDQGYRSIKNTAFKAGEELKFRIHYGFMDAGEAVLKVEESKFDFNGRKALHIVGTGESLGGFDWFFKVRDRYETYVDKEGLFPYRFIRNINEGGYKIHQDYTFMPTKRAVKTQRNDKTPKNYKTPAFVQDMMSAFFYARTFDYTDAKKGDIFTVETIIDGEIFPLQIKYLETEVVKIRAGKFRCMKFVPILQEGRVFEDEDDLNIWITDDENKIPVLVKSELLIGSIKMEMTEWKGLANPLSKVD